MGTLFDKYINSVKDIDTIHYTGRVTAVRGNLIESKGPQCVMGEICTIKIPIPDISDDFRADLENSDSEKFINILAEVCGLSGTTVQLMAYGDTKGIEVGCEVVGSGSILKVGVGPELLGRVVDATGHAYDDLGEIEPECYYPAINNPPSPMSRKPVERRITTGVRSIDSMLTVGKGQRLGIFAGSGVGKSTLLSMIARNTDADVNVIGLIGERGREVLDFIKRDLGEEGLKRSVVVVATSDQPAICRLRSAYVCTAIAEYFRDKGKDVMKACKVGCIGCMMCTKVCPTGATFYDKKSKKLVFEYDKCIGCGQCVYQCKFDVRHMVKDERDVFVKTKKKSEAIKF